MSAGHRMSDPSALIGREAELGAIVSAVGDARLVTLTGLGGVGKTRLASAAMERIAIDGLGRHFVDLTRTAAVEDVPAEVAAAMGIVGAGDDLSATVIAELGHRPTLLVLDNLEHLLGAGAFATAILDGAPTVRILATSRIRLGLPGELELPIGPLALPASTDAVESAAASRLFLRRARERSALVDLAPTDAQLVGDICRLLDGLPLALELAASWTRILTPAAIVRRLATGGLATLADSGAPPGLLEQIVEATLRLVGEREREAFDAAGAFIGGFDEPAARAVFGSDAALAILRQLESVALVRAEADERGEPRFTMLETIRSVAAARLAGRRDEPAIRRRHLDHFAETGFAMSRALRDAAPAPALAWLRRDEPNLKAAFETALRERDAAAACRIGIALEAYANRIGSFRETEARLVHALELGPATDAIRAEALLGLANLHLMVGRDMDLGLLTREAVRLARGSADRRLLTRALNLHGVIGRPDEAIPLLEESIAVAADDGYGWGEAYALMNLAATHAEAGRLDAALEAARRALAIAREIDDGRWIGSALTTLGGILGELERFAEASESLAAGIAALREVEPGGAGISNAIATLALIEGRAGRLADARRHLAEAADRALASDRRQALAEVLDAAIAVLASTDPVIAAHALGAVEGEPRFLLSPRAAARLESAATTTIVAAIGPRRTVAERDAGRDADRRTIVERIRASAAARVHSPEDRLQAPYGLLTPREEQILELLAAGRSDHEIGAELGISPKTASVHVTNVKTKLGVETRTEAALAARDLESKRGG